MSSPGSPRTLWHGLDLSKAPRNLPLHYSGSSKTYRGVFQTDSGRFKVNAHLDGTCRHFGTYDTAEEAALVYAQVMYLLEKFSPHRLSRKPHDKDRQPTKHSSPPRKIKDSPPPNGETSLSDRSRIFGDLDLNNAPRDLPLWMSTRTGSTKYRGVWLRKDGVYCTKLGFRGRTYKLGEYETPEEAALAYAQAGYILGMGKATDPPKASPTPPAPPQPPQEAVDEHESDATSGSREIGIPNLVSKESDDNDSVYGGFDLSGISKDLPLEPSSRSTLSKYKGVSPKVGRWESRALHGGKTFYLGAFATEKEAATIRARAMEYLRRKGDALPQAPPNKNTATKVVPLPREQPRRSLPPTRPESEDTDSSDEDTDGATRDDESQSDDDRDMIGKWDVSNVPTNLPLLESKNPSGYRGVTFCKRSSKWEARMSYNGSSRYLGAYATVQQAALAYARVAYYLEHVEGQQGVSGPTKRGKTTKPDKWKKLKGSSVSSRDTAKRRMSNDSKSSKKARVDNDIYNGLDLSLAPRDLPPIPSASENSKNPYRGISRRSSGKYEVRFKTPLGRNRYVGAFDSAKEAGVIFARVTYLVDRGLLDPDRHLHDVESVAASGVAPAGSVSVPKAARVVNVAKPARSVRAPPKHPKGSRQYDISEVDSLSEDDDSSVYGGLDLSGIPHLPPIPAGPGKKAPFKGLTYRRGIWESRFRWKDKIFYLGGFKSAKKAGSIHARAKYYLTQMNDPDYLQDSSDMGAPSYDGSIEEKHVEVEDNVIAFPTDSEADQSSKSEDIHGGFDLSGVPRDLPLIRSTTNSKSIYKGVYMSSPTSYQVRITTNTKKDQYIGSYKTMEEAALVYARVAYYLYYFRGEALHRPDLSASDDEQDLYADPGFVDPCVGFGDYNDCTTEVLPYTDKTKAHGDGLGSVVSSSSAVDEEPFACSEPIIVI